MQEEEDFAISLSDGREHSTQIVLQNKKVESMNSGVNLETPSILFQASNIILFQASNIEIIYEKLKNNDITVGNLVEFPGTQKRVFNFCDPEQNYFAMIEE